MVVGFLTQLKALNPSEGGGPIQLHVTFIQQKSRLKFRKLKSRIHLTISKGSPRSQLT